MSSHSACQSQLATKFTVYNNCRADSKGFFFESGVQVQGLNPWHAQQVLIIMYIYTYLHKNPQILSPKSPIHKFSLTCKWVSVIWDTERGVAD